MKRRSSRVVILRSDDHIGLIRLLTLAALCGLTCLGFLGLRRYDSIDFWTVTSLGLTAILFAILARPLMKLSGETIVIDRREGKLGYFRMRSDRANPDIQDLWGRREANTWIDLSRIRQVQVCEVAVRGDEEEWSECSIRVELSEGDSIEVHRDRWEVTGRRIARRLAKKLGVPLAGEETRTPTEPAGRV